MIRLQKKEYVRLTAIASLRRETMPSRGKAHSSPTIARHVRERTNGGHSCHPSCFFHDCCAGAVRRGDARTESLLDSCQQQQQPASGRRRVVVADSIATVTAVQRRLIISRRRYTLSSLQSLSEPEPTKRLGYQHVMEKRPSRHRHPPASSSVAETKTRT